MKPAINASCFWQQIEHLVATSNFVIDRPAGSRHPRYPTLVYPLAYGYLADTVAADGAGIDVWIGSQSQRKLTGIVCTVDLDKRDAEMKVLLGCTPEDIATILAFHNQGSQAAMVVLPAAAVPRSEET